MNTSKRIIMVNAAIEDTMTILEEFNGYKYIQQAVETSLIQQFFK